MLGKDILIPGKEAVEKALTEAGKEAKIKQDFERQRAEAELRIAQLKTANLEDIIKSQNQQIEALKNQLENALSKLKDLAVAVVDGSRKENTAGIDNRQ